MLLLSDQIVGVILADKHFPVYSLNQWFLNLNPFTQRLKRRRESEWKDDFCDFKEEVKNTIRELLAESDLELQKIKPILTDIQQTNHNIETTVAFLASQNEELKKKIEHLEGQAKKDRDQITMLENKIEDLQRDSRNTYIEIKNVPKTTNETQEDLIRMVTSCSLAKNIDCQITTSDIKDIYRINVKKDTKNTPVVVETSSAIVRSNILKMSKAYNVKHPEKKLCAKQLGFATNEDTPIFISEQLTAKGARLYFLARDLIKSKIYKFCWTAYGRVYVRKNEDSPKINITSESQVHKLKLEQ